jgi:hypothetical protein
MLAGAVLIAIPLLFVLKEDALSNKAEDLYDEWLAGDIFVPLLSCIHYRSSHRDVDFPGCYVLHNITKGTYIVGHSEKVFWKIERTSHSVNDYADFNYHSGDKCEIKVIPLVGSGYASLEEMENELNRKFSQK